MAATGQRLEALSFNRNLFRIVSLLFLLHVGQTQDFQTQLMNGIQRVREGIRVIIEGESGTEYILTLLDDANSVANKKQLKIFQQYLQEAVDEAYRQKVEKKAEITVSGQLFHMMIPEYLAKMQTLSKPLADSMEHMLEIFRNYLKLKKNMFTQETKETETKLEDALNNLKSRQNCHNPVGVKIILLLLFLCIVAVYKICYRIITWIIRIF
ncbi:uncharacterized protein LOC129357242 [Poeciliopsis prolifica]|uniref:uncharacterized protein LOC129357242 n=1 Tax=Poeciliopsis prolifica TaxID=188132 RepID=UPI0024141A68|nr:uncharacterized protein LOC129357242 [Poeciliopsis prolifica]